MIEIDDVRQMARQIQEQYPDRVNPQISEACQYWVNEQSCFAGTILISLGLATGEELHRHENTIVYNVITCLRLPVSDEAANYLNNVQLRADGWRTGNFPNPLLWKDIEL